MNKRIVSILVVIFLCLVLIYACTSVKKDETESGKNTTQETLAEDTTISENKNEELLAEVETFPDEVFPEETIKKDTPENTENNKSVPNESASNNYSSGGKDTLGELADAPEF